MLKAQQKYPQQELARRLVEAMEESNVSLAELSRACGVTIQSVYDWRKTGRIGKQHLMTICRVTRKPLEYFLVGIGRAAMISVVALSALVVQPAEARGLHNKNSEYALHKFKRLFRKLRNRCGAFAKWRETTAYA